MHAILVSQMYHDFFCCKNILMKLIAEERDISDEGEESNAWSDDESITNKKNKENASGKNI